MKLYAMVAVPGKNFCICDEKGGKICNRMVNTAESFSKPVVTPGVKNLKCCIRGTNLGLSIEKCKRKPSLWFAKQGCSSK